MSRLHDAVLMRVAQPFGNLGGDRHRLRHRQRAALADRERSSTPSMNSTPCRQRSPLAHVVHGDDVRMLRLPAARASW